MRQKLAAIVLLALLALATMGAKQYRDPTGGYFLFNSDSTYFAGASTDTLIDSLRAPNGEVIAKVVLRANQVGTQKLLLGFDHVVDDTTHVDDVDEWVYVQASGQSILGVDDVGEWFTFYPGCEKVYIKSGGSAGGLWSWEAYSVAVKQDQRSISYQTSGAHSPLNVSYGLDAFTLLDVETTYGEDMYFRIASDLATNEMIILLMRNFYWAWFCPSPPYSGIINKPYCVGYAEDVDSSSTATRVWIQPNLSSGDIGALGGTFGPHTEFQGAWLTYKGIGKHANDGTSAQGMVWEYTR